MLSQAEFLFIYRWFSHCLGRELSEAQFARLQAGEFTPFFTFLREAGFDQWIQILQDELNKLADFPYAHLELAADFAQCFLLEDKLSAQPYASAYLHGRELEQNLAEMDRWLDTFALQTNRQVNEPSDHLCVYLEILLKLVEQHSIAMQKQFIQQQLLSWLPKLAENLPHFQLKSRVYPTLIQLLVEILTSHLNA